MLAVTIAIFLLLAEWITRIYYAKNGKLVAMDEEDKCSKQLYKQISNISTINRFNPGFTSYYEYSNFTGIMPQANINFNELFMVNEEGSGINFIFAAEKTNAQHMRALKNFSYEKSPGVIRIALMGDSFTWGADVPFKYTYGSILEELVLNSEVLNFGVEGVGIDVMYLRWKYESLKFNPDVMVFTMFIDDIRRARPCIHKPKLSRKGGNLEITNLPPPSYEEILKTYKEPKVMSYFFEHLIFKINTIGGSLKEYQNGLDILELQLNEMKLYSQREHSYFMVLLIEAGNDYKNNKLELDYIDKTKEILRKMQIPYITSKEIFGRERFVATDTSPFKNMGHFTPEGYGLLAQGIKNKLEKDGVIQKQKDYNYKWVQVDSSLFLTNKINKSDVMKITPYINSSDSYVDIKRKYLTERTNIDGKPAYIIKKNDKSFIKYDNKEIGKEYDTVDYIAEFNGKLFYIAEENGSKFVVYDGQEIGKEFKNSFRE